MQPLPFHHTFVLYGLMFLLFNSQCTAQQKMNTTAKTEKEILPAAARTESYLPLLKGKNVAVFANQTSIVGAQHLVDVMQKAGVHISVSCGPEHGFRGTTEAGEKVESGIDKAT